MPAPATQGPLVSDAGQVRALVLEIARPADWAALSVAWQGAQIDLDLPAAGIAVSGTDGLQLWFSLTEPVPATDAVAFVQGLQRRYLAAIPAQRVQGFPQAAPHSPGAWQHANEVPAVQASGNWSAFISADLPAVFADEPWLDIPPHPEQQADILSRLRSITPPQFQHALALLDARQDSPPARAAAAPTELEAPAKGTPRAFLLQVMHDPQVDMQHRIEAAKVLLEHGGS